MNETGNPIHVFNQRIYSQILTPMNNGNTSEDIFSVNLTENELFHYNVTHNIPSTDIWTTIYETLLEMLSMSPLITIMLAMGCEISCRNILDEIKRPIGLCIGAFCQFVIMPVSGFCILMLTGIKGLHATAVLIISCSPGGGLSNTFTYFCDGDLALSVAMTTFSALLGMGMMPFNMWIYGSQFQTDDQVIIPYKGMAMSLMIASTPMLAGMLIRWKFPKFAAKTTKVASYLSVFLALISLGTEVVFYPNMFTDVPVELYVVLFSLPFLGLTMGYVLASLLNRKGPVRKAVSIECGIQNVPISLTVIVLSYTPEVQEQIILFPYLYLFGMSTSCMLFCLTYNFWKRFIRKTNDETPPGNHGAEDLLAKHDVQSCSTTEAKIKPNTSPFSSRMERKLWNSNYVTINSA